MPQSSAIAALQCELVSPKSTQEGEEYMQSNSHQTVATQHRELPRGTRMGKHKMLAPVAEMQMKGMIAVSPDSCIFPDVHECPVCLCAQPCPTVCDPMNCRLPGISVHGISQVRILEWVAISSFRASSQSRD